MATKTGRKLVKFPSDTTLKLVSIIAILSKYKILVSMSEQMAQHVIYFQYCDTNNGYISDFYVQDRIGNT